MSCNMPTYPIKRRHFSTANVQFIYRRESRGGLISSPFCPFLQQETVNVNSFGALGFCKNSIFCTHLQDTKKLQKGRTGKEISRAKLKKATQIALRWLWRSRGLRRREACFYCALEIHLHQGGSAVWPLMELAEEEPHALSVLHHGFTESNDSFLLITTGAIPVFQNP